MLSRQPEKSKVTILYKYVSRYRKNLESKKLRIDEIRTSPELGYTSRKNIQNLMSKLKILIEDFLVMQSLSEDSNERELRIFQIYNDRGLYGLANNKADVLTKLWSEKGNIDMNSLLCLLRLRHSQYFSENPISYEGKNLLHTLISTFKDLSDVYGDFYEFVNEHAISLNHKFYYKESERKKFEVTQKLIKIISSISALHNDKNIEAFEYLDSQLINQSNISPEMKSLMFEFCERFLRLKIETENSEYFSHKILDFYEFGMNKEILLYKGAISSVKFQNIIHVACFVKNYIWADNFVSKYIDLVPAPYRLENEALANININFGLHNFNKAIRIANSCEFKLMTAKSASRWFLLVCNYITHDTHDFMDSQINNFIQFFYYNKAKISSRMYVGSLNLAKIIRSAFNQPNEFNLDVELEKYDHIIFKTRLQSIFNYRDIYIKKHNIQVK